MRRWLAAFLLLAVLWPPVPSRAEWVAPCKPYLDMMPEVRAAAERLIDQRIVRPRPDSEIGGLPDVTRAEAVTMLVWALGWEEAVKALPDGEELPFADLRDHWARREITLAAREGLVRGYPDGNFGPNRKTALTELEWMIARALRANPAISDPTQALVSVGVNPTVPCAPDRFANRYQAFLLLDRLMTVSLDARHKASPACTSMADPADVDGPSVDADGDKLRDNLERWMAASGDVGRCYPVIVQLAVPPDDPVMQHLAARIGVFEAESRLREPFYGFTARLTLRQVADLATAADVKAIIADLPVHADL